MFAELIVRHGRGMFGDSANLRKHPPDTVDGFVDELLIINGEDPVRAENAERQFFRRLVIDWIFDPHGPGARSGLPLLAPPDDPEHAVIVGLPGPPSDPLEDALIAAIEATRAGQLDGNEYDIARNSTSIYMYGPDADVLFAAVEPILRTVAAGEATKRYGPPGSSEQVVPLAPSSD